MKRSSLVTVSALALVAFSIGVAGARASSPASGAMGGTTGSTVNSTSQIVDVAARIALMQTKTEAAKAKLLARQTAGITRIQALKSSGASQAKIQVAAKMTVRGIDEAAGFGHHEVRAIGDMTIAQLTRQNADAATIASVKAARDADQLAIATAAGDARKAVHDAVAGSAAASTSGGGTGTATGGGTASTPSVTN